MRKVLSTLLEFVSQPVCMHNVCMLYLSSHSAILIKVDNNLNGEIPQELNYLSNLEILNLYYNSLTGIIPDLGQLTALGQIDLDGNALTG
jgi:Leucine-rich repeat (LRR) protein